MRKKCVFLEFYIYLTRSYLLGLEDHEKILLQLSTFLANITLTASIKLVHVSPGLYSLVSSWCQPAYFFHVCTASDIHL